MTITTACRDMAIHLEHCAAGTLAGEEARSFEGHLQKCHSCRERLKHFRSVRAVMQDVFGAEKPADELAEQAGRWLSAASPESVSDYVSRQEHPMGSASRAERWLGGAPWWFVSLTLHVLIIALAGLLTLAVELPRGEDGVMMITELQPARSEQVDAPKPEQPLTDILASTASDAKTDGTSDIVVMPDILARAELGDHFETINPDMPDTHSAYGNPDVKSFSSVTGNTEPAGGGGMGGPSGLGLQDVIGVGGAASAGSGGGFGGGNGAGVGTGTGAGKGSFGQRMGGGRRLMVMAEKHGGGKATQSAVDAGLDWLARNQEADGHWDNIKWGGNHKQPCINVACTGMAVLAFLGAGHTEKLGKYQENVRKGIHFIITELDGQEFWKTENGWNVAEGTGGYTLGIATLALCEAYGMARIPETKRAAQKAVDAVLAFQRGEGSEREAWGYCKGDSVNDTSVTGWQVMALKAAKITGLKSDVFAFEGALRWVNAAQDCDVKPGDFDPYTYEGGKMAYRGTVAKPGKEQGVCHGALSACAALVRLFVGGGKPDEPGVIGPCNYMKGHLPEVRLSEDGKRQTAGSFYYLYYGTYVMFQEGGDHWAAWNAALKKTLLAIQCKGGPEDGSWHPCSRHSDNDNRVMSTAMGCLCLEVYYRYLQIYPKGN